MSEDIQFPIEQEQIEITIKQQQNFSIASLASLSLSLDYQAISLQDCFNGTYQGKISFDFKADLSKAKFLLKLAGIHVNALEEGNFVSQDFHHEFINYSTEEFKAFKKTISLINQSGSENVSINSAAKKILDALKAEVKDFELESKPLYISYNYDNQMNSGNMTTFNNLFSQFARGKNASNESVDKERLGIFGKYYDSTKENNFNHVIKLYENHQAVFELILDANLPIRFKFYGSWEQK